MNKHESESRSIPAEDTEVLNRSNTTPVRPEPDPVMVEQRRQNLRREVKKEIQNLPPGVREAATPIQERPLLKWQGVGYFLDNPAPEPKLLFYGKAWEIPDKCIIALFAAGGTGKTFLGFQLAACLATGLDLPPFITKPPKGSRQKKKVLYLCGEDHQDIIHRRIRAIFHHMPGLADRRADFAASLHVSSLVGQERIMISYDQQGNPSTTPVFDWLCKSIEKMPGVDVLVIDPMSKFFGLNENDNVHGAAWIAMLENLSIRYNIAVLFVHHESKQQNKSGDIQGSTGRGAGAFRDNARGVLSMAKMDSAKAKKYNYPDNWKKLVSVMPTKVNYTEDAEQEAWYRRGPDGVLLPADLIRERNDNLSAELFDLLRQAVTGQLSCENGKPISCTRDSLTVRGLTRGPGSDAEKLIRSAMKETGVSNLKDDLTRLLFRLEAENKITIDRAPDGGRTNKQRLTVVGYNLRPEQEPGDQDEEKQPTTPDLVESGTGENSPLTRPPAKSAEEQPINSNQSKKHGKKSPGRKGK